MKQAELVKQSVLENEYATMWYYPQINIVHHKVHKFIYGEKLREILTKGADIFEEHSCIKWLSDDRNNSALPAKDIEWASQEWSPRMVKANWKYWAIILPDKTVGKLNMKRIISTYAEVGVTVEIFDDEQDALTWLSSLPD